ncbi:MAG: hypothetical protein LQ349_005544 [Xanthoria aureola]|nr:MAG: hypothetical protein LQ349_005544 [Xanthoria aureola]
MPVKPNIPNPFHHTDTPKATAHPTSPITTTSKSSTKSQPLSRDQLDRQKAEEKRRAVLDKRYEKECLRAQDQRAHRQQKRWEGHEMGYADHLGEDPLSDIRLTKQAIGVEVRKRMPGIRWEDPRER